MSMREKMARAIAEKELSPLLGILSDPVADNMFDALWEKDTSELRTRVFAQLDAVLDEALDVSETVYDVGQCRCDLGTFPDIVFAAMIQAIKDDK